MQRVGPGTNGDPTFSAIDPELRQPYLHELITGFELRPKPSIFMRLAAIGRREHHLVGVVNVGVPNSTYTAIGVPDTGVDLIGSGTIRRCSSSTARPTPSAPIATCSRTPSGTTPLLSAPI